MTNKSKKLRYSGEDRISALPDHLLHYILCFLVLGKMITTSVLSKRWRFLWTSVPVLDLGDWLYSSKYSDISSSITDSLIQYRGQKITKFRVLSFFKLRHENIDTWIRFAVNRDVKEFDLSDLYCGSDRQLDRYEVLECLLNCESLELLKLTSCKLNLNVTSSNLCSLKKLELQFMWLSNLDTSGCPLLESIILYHCNMNQPLNIYAPNLKLGFLKIKDCNCAPPVTLFAPNLKSIQFEDGFRMAYNIMNLSSLTTVSFQLVGRVRSIRVRRNTTLQFMELLQGLLHASTLRLDHGFMEVMSFLKAGVALPQARTTRLELKINMQKSDLIGMALVLSSAQSLETLTLDIGSIEKHSKDRHLDDLSLDDLWKSVGCSMSDIRSLKKIEIYNFLGSESEMLRNEPVSNFTIDEFILNKREKEIELVKILLSSCTTLETMTIKTLLWPRKSEFLLALSERLLAFPRVSKNAEISFT